MPSAKWISGLSQHAPRNVFLLVAWDVSFYSGPPTNLDEDQVIPHIPLR
jgi:hypothetical protein